MVFAIEPADVLTQLVVPRGRPVAERGERRWRDARPALGAANAPGAYSTGIGKRAVHLSQDLRGDTGEEAVEANGQSGEERENQLRVAPTAWAAA